PDDEDEPDGDVPLDAPETDLDAEADHETELGHDEPADEPDPVDEDELLAEDEPEGDEVGGDEVGGDELDDEDEPDGDVPLEASDTDLGEHEDEDEHEDEHEHDHRPPPFAVDPDAEDTGEIHPVPGAFAPLAPSALDADDAATEAAPSGEEPHRPRRRWLRRALVAAVLLLGLAYVGGWWLTGERTPAQASIGGVDVGGLSPTAAQRAVETELGPREADAVVLEHEKKTFEIDPADVGLSLDAKGSVDQVVSRSWDPRRMVALVAGKHTYDPVVDVDDTKLADSVDSVAEAVQVPVTQALITFPGGKPKAREPQEGLVARKDDTAQAVKDAYLAESGPVAVPTAVVDPMVDSAGLKKAMTEIAQPAVAAPVAIRVGEKTIKLPVSAYTPALTVGVVDGAMKPRIDAEKLAEPLTDATTGIGRKAVDATVVIRGGKPVVVPGKDGVGLQPEEMAKKLVPVLTRTGDARSISIEADVVEPEFTTADAKKLQIKERVSEFETEFPYAEYRNINQARAAELIDGVIVKPGETFSFNDTVGERTEAAGFVVGTIINGGVFREELGGGVSQVVTTTYNAAFFAGMDDVEHHPHAFYISRYPVGREATVAWGYLDLKFKNPTKYGVLIRASVKKSTPGSAGVTRVELWSTKVWDVKAGKSAKRNLRDPGTRYDDTPACVAQDPVQGFDIDIYRTFFSKGKKVKSETVTANYQAADKVICGKKPTKD
ncbi:MAG: hypothetical protein EON52_01515, partial [Actinomycetales bacterium]